eukprot:1161841-Pelagomonas_calceolata.AAC.10
MQPHAAEGIPFNIWAAPKQKDSELLGVEEVAAQCSPMPLRGSLFDFGRTKAEGFGAARAEEVAPQCSHMLLRGSLLNIWAAPKQKDSELLSMGEMAVEKAAGREAGQTLLQRRNFWAPQLPVWKGGIQRQVRGLRHKRKGNLLQLLHKASLRTPQMKRWREGVSRNGEPVQGRRKIAGVCKI